MSQTVRIAVNMQPVPDAVDGTVFHATLPMAVLFEKSLDPAQVEQERDALQAKYQGLVQTLRTLRPMLKRRSAIDNWMFGDAIVAFEQDTSDSLLFVDRLSEHLSRDVNYGRAMIDLCRRFRLHLPDKTRIDPTITFAAYHRSGFDTRRAREYAVHK